MKFGKLRASALLILVIALVTSSCGGSKNVSYFNGVKDGNIVSNTPLPESIIQKNDILNITVSSLNPEASLVFNSPSATGNSAPGYLVNADGDIMFPMLGTIKAEGLTKNQLKENIAKSLHDKKLLLDPIVTIRYSNFRVTVLGEVNSPTVVSVPSEKISLLEALGLAGDLTIYAKRQNVMIIREENNEKIIKRIDLNSAELFTSPYYYLKSGDIVYVEPNKTKVASTSRAMQWLPIVMSGLSLALIAYQTTQNN
jgi:polysaccharide export outer membrane protein